MSATALPATALPARPVTPVSGDRAAPVREPSWIVPMLGFTLSLFATTGIALALAAL